MTESPEQPQKQILPALLVTVGGLGHLRPAPGTWGSLPPAAMAGALLFLGANSASYHLLLAGVLVIFSAACVYWGTWAESQYGRKDPRAVVADETAGQCIPLAFPPIIADATSFDGLLSIFAFCGGAFLLFRIFDIIKPPPAHQLQRLKAGTGILVDDLIAGLYALVVMQLAIRFVF